MALYGRKKRFLGKEVRYSRWSHYTGFTEDQSPFECFRSEKCGQHDQRIAVVLNSKPGVSLRSARMRENWPIQDAQIQDEQNRRIKLSLRPLPNRSDRDKLLNTTSLYGPRLVSGSLARDRRLSVLNRRCFDTLSELGLSLREKFYCELVWATQTFTNGTGSANLKGFR